MIVDKDLLIILEKFDNIKTENYFPFDKETILGEGIGVFEKTHNETGMKMLRREWMLLNHTVALGNMIPDKWNYILDNLDIKPSFWTYDDVDIEYFKERLKQDISTISSARINYYLWIATGIISYAEKSIKLFIDSGLEHSKTGETTKYYKVPEFCFKISFELAKKLKKFSEVKDKLIQSIIESISLNEKENRSYKYRSLIEVFLIIIAYAWNDINNSEKEITKEIIKKCNNLSKIFKTEGNLHLSNCWLGFIDKFSSEIKDSETSKSSKIKILNNLILMGDRFKDPISKVGSYDSALRYMTTYNIDNQEKKDHILSLISDNNKNIGIQFKKIETPVTIKKQDIEKELKRIIGKSTDTKDIVKILSKYMFPSYEQVNTFTKASTSGTLLSVIPIVKHTENFISKSYSTKAEIMEYRINTQISLSLQMNAMLIAHGMEMYKITTGKILSIIQDSDISENSKNILKIGVKKHFEEDYVSSVHILTFQIEELIRCAMRKKGYTSFVFNQKSDSMRQQLLDRLLRNDDVKKIFGVDFCHSLMVHISNPDFHNIRNGIAHGILDFKEFNKQNSMIVLFIILYILTNFK